MSEVGPETSSRRRIRQRVGTAAEVGIGDRGGAVARDGRHAGGRGGRRVARSVRHVAGGRGDGGGAAAGVGRGGTERRHHLLSARSSIGVDGWASGIRRRWVTEINRGIVRVGRPGVLIHGVLHLLEHLVDLGQVLLGAKVGHGWQIVVLGERSGMGTTTHGEGVGSLGHVLGRYTAASLEAKTMDGHQRAAYLLVGAGVNLTALEVSEELVQVIQLALLPGVGIGRGMVAHEISAGSTHVLRVVHGGPSVIRWVLGSRGVLAVVTRLTILLVRVAKGAGVSTAHVAIMIIESGGS